MAEVATNLEENLEFQSQNSINSEPAQPAYEGNQFGNEAEVVEQYVEHTSRVEISSLVNNNSEEKDSPDSKYQQLKLNPTSVLAAKRKEPIGEESYEIETSRLDNGIIQQNGGVYNQEKNSIRSSDLGGRNQEMGVKDTEAKAELPVSPLLHVQSRPDLATIPQKHEASPENSLVANKEEKEDKEKKGLLKTKSNSGKFCSCFGQSKTKENYDLPSPVTHAKLSTATAEGRLSSKENDKTRSTRPARPTRQAPSAPAPKRDAPPIPSPNRRAPHPPSHESQRVENLQKQFFLSESGSESNRESAEIESENQEVDKLQGLIYNEKYHYYKMPFEGNDVQDESYQKWAEEDFKKREFLYKTIEEIPRLGRASRNRVWYIEYVKISPELPGSTDSEWKNVVLIGFDEEKEVKIFEKELRDHYETSTWALKDYNIQVEVGKGMRACAAETDSQIFNLSPIGAPIFVQNLEMVSTFCGVSCHIRGSDKISDSFCTIGGILFINRKFFALTSAHPFQDAIDSGRNKDIASELPVGKLISYKFGSPIRKENKSNTLVSDWALISLEDDYIKPNSVLLKGSNLPIPITGYLPTSQLKVGKVWVCSSRGPKLGVLNRNSMIVGMLGKVFETQPIRLIEELVDGDSGSWVVRNGKLCGFVISRTFGDATQAWAYMIPIEQVFEDIQKHLESTWKSEISNPQTWLGEPLPKSTPENNPTVQLVESEIQNHKKEEVQAQRLQDDGPALLVEKSTNLAAAQSEILLVSDHSHPEELVTADHRSNADPDFERAPIKETILSDQEEPQVQAELPASAPRRPSDLTVPVEVISEPVSPHADISIDPPQNADPIGIPSVDLGPATQIANDEINTIGEGQEKEDEGKEEDEKKGGEKKKDVNEKDEKRAAQKNGDRKKDVQKDEQKKDLTAQQKGKEKEEHDTKQGERTENEEHPQRELPIKTEALSIRPAAGWLDYRPVLSRFVDPRHPPNEIPSVMEAISHLWKRGNVGTKKLTRDVMFEVVVFNDLMSQLTYAITPTNTTSPKDGQKAEWWQDHMWFENLVSSLGNSKSGLILEILSREVKLIRRIVSISDDFLLPVNLIFAWQTIRELRSNNSRLKILVERLPPIPSYQQEPDHQERDHLLTVEQIPEETKNSLYDCTKYLELYKVLMHQGLFNLVGLSVLNVWAREVLNVWAREVLNVWARDESGRYVEEPLFVFLESYDNKPIESNNIFDTNRSFIPAQWWGMVSVNEGDIRPHEIGFREMDDGFFKCKAFSTSLEREYGSSQLVTFNPVSLQHSPNYSFVSFKGMFRSGRVSLIPGQEFFKMALILSCGMIFLSPTPWYPENPDHLWDQILFYLDTNHRLVDVVFAVNMFPREARQVPHAKKIILRLGMALIELALRKEIDGDPQDHLRSGFVALEMGVKYQNIVKTCLTGKYENSSGIQVIDEDLASFQKRANEAIIMPLRALWHEMRIPRSIMSGGR